VLSCRGDPVAFSLVVFKKREVLALFDGQPEATGPAEEHRPSKVTAVGTHHRDSGLQFTRSQKDGN